MPFQILADKVRQQPLGPAALNGILNNQRSTQTFAAAEHAPDGKHNALTVARAVAFIEHSAGYTINPLSSPEITAVSGTGGVVDITLEADKFSLPMVVKCSVITDDWANLPYMIDHQVINATTVRVFIRRVASIAANVWGATDVSFAIAIHSERYTSAATPLAYPLERSRGQTFHATPWNTIVQNQAAQQVALLAGHTAAGVHNAVEVAYGYGQFEVDSGGTSYTKTYGENVTSVTRSSAGVLALNVTGARYVEPVCFFSPTYRSNVSGATPADTYLMGMLDGPSSTVVDLRIWKYKTVEVAWELADCDFAVVLHDEAA